MDKNTLIGLLLIGAIIIGFSIYNKPDQEQLAKQSRLRDTAQLVETEKARLEVENDLKDTAQPQSTQNTVKDFFSAAQRVAQVNDTLQESVNTNVIKATDSSFVAQPAEQLIPLENNKIKLLLSTAGGGIHSVNLKEFLRYTKDSLYYFEGDEARFNLEIFNRNSVKLATENQTFQPIISKDGNSVTMRLQSSANQFIDFIYTLPEDEYMMKLDIRLTGMRDGLHPESLSNFKIYWSQKLRQQEKGEAFERRYARIFYRYESQSVEQLSQTKDDTKEVSEPVQWFAFKDQFFTSIIIPDKPFSNLILTSKNTPSGNYLKDYKAEAWVPVTTNPEIDEYKTGFRYYFGPVHYNSLKAYDKDVKNSSDKLFLQEQVELGYTWLSWVNKFFVIPVFDFFLSLNWSMGLIILILTLLVKMIILPLTYKSFKSSAKMRVLKPQIHEIEKKFPGQEQDMMVKRQKATMELYNKAGVNPMSGCLPMLLQMPVLLALFFFFPSAIELRQQGFLWADDLSTYDSIISWSGNIPMVTRFLGNHISLFCLLMTIVNVFYTKYSMSMTDTGQQQMAGMKYMPIFMSVFMFFFLNNYPSGLNYYYFLSTLITIIVTLFFKQFLNEDKLLAQLEANKLKPKKKKSGGLMARLEEAQKMQEKQMRERGKQSGNKNYRK